MRRMPGVRLVSVFFIALSLGALSAEAANSGGQKGTKLSKPTTGVTCGSGEQKVCEAGTGGTKCWCTKKKSSSVSSTPSAESSKESQ